MKVKGSLYWIYSFTSGCKGKMLVAILLAVIGVLCGMAPYFALAGILSGLIQNTLTAERIVCYVGIAVLGETLKMLFNTVSSLKAHRAAYHILGNIRCKLAEKMMRVPMGIMVDTPSGKLKAMVVDTVDKLEQPLAHMLPEITANVFTPLCIIILLFILDWRMALACMIVIPIGFLLLMGQMKDYKNRSDRYIEASGNMDSSLVEYVNGIEVIKTFSQTGKSFQKFSDAVKNYHDTTLDWWKNTWLYSALGLTVIPATLVGGIPVAGILGEAARKVLGYKSFKGIALAGGFTAFGFIGSPLPMWLFQDAYMKSIEEMGMGVEYVEGLHSMISAGSFIGMLAVAFVGGLIGTLVGRLMLKKHFEKAGIV